MSIKEIKDVKKLQSMLNTAQTELKYVKECCEKAGLELSKNSFEWDGKEKNIVVQAMELNSRFEAEKDKVKELEQWQEDAENILKMQLDNFDKIENRYKQALEEIRGMAENFYNNSLKNRDCVECDDSIGKILQKCEVLEDE